MAPRTHRNALQSDFEILWSRIESILGQGGFGNLSWVSDRWFGTCGAITGSWRYSTGRLVTPNADGTAKRDLVVVFHAAGTWEYLNPARREIRIIWNTGFTDRLTVMAGARRLEDKNNLGLPSAALAIFSIYLPSSWS